ncbi:MAG: Gfo/Idh/MocA family oxidoreductase [Planctomycetaceae bacterium]|nr:Gfo/Idh/MocA family oxidoreductase [Planctomycetaceae bacterium]
MALKVGVVGLRGIGSSHTDCYSKNPLAKLVAVCDVHKDRADDLAARYNVKKYYSLKDMLANEDLDIVDVSTGGYENGSWHYEPAMQAMDAGKHVLVEKPISNDIACAREMVAKAYEKNVYLGCNLNHYFTPTAEKAKKHMTDGHVGELVYCLHKMGFNGGEETYNPNQGSRFGGHKYAHLKAFLTHPFSVMRFFCGDITHLQAFVDKTGIRRHAGDAMLSIASIHCRFENGAVGYLLSQRGDVAYGLGGWWSVEVAGTRGTFCIENCIEKMTFWPAPTPTSGSMMGQTATSEVFESGTADFGVTFPNRIHAFLEDITNGVPKEKLRASGRDALAVLEYTWATMESFEQGGILVRPHPLPLLKGDPIAMKD